VLVTRGMLNFVRSDDELAYVLAKEMAHNALAHAQKQRMNATIGGIIDNLVRMHPDLSTMSGTAGVKPMPAELDKAADTLALYLVARAGYDVTGAPAFWQRLAAQYPPSVANAYNAIHAPIATRLPAIDKTVADITRKLAASKPLLP
jgi:predicted Zn-dependent protease